MSVVLLFVVCGVCCSLFFVCGSLCVPRWRVVRSLRVSLAVCCLLCVLLCVLFVLVCCLLLVDCYLLLFVCLLCVGW